MGYVEPWTLNLVKDGRTDAGNDNTLSRKLASGKKDTKVGFVPDCWTGHVLWCGQAQNVVNLDFQVKFGLEGQGPIVF